VTVVPYVLLAILAGSTAVVKRSTGGSLLIDLALCALAAAWMLSMFTLHPAWRERPPVMAVFLAVLLVYGGSGGQGSLVRILHACWLFLRVRTPILAVGIGRRCRGRDCGGHCAGVRCAKQTAFRVMVYVAVLAVNVLPMCGLAWFGRHSDQQNRQREQALEQAREANGRLEATLAENAGLHEQLISQAREAGIVDERQRMAREIHDTLAQGLTGIITQLQAAEQASQDPVRWRRHFAAATGLARESLSEARRSVHALRPEPLETARLSEALAGVAER
jgi:signal transduction histidine kinase